ncbi:MAG: PAS domain-containing protein [Spirochaetales bacterium]|nr:MAG: PAS domain-containing protein [Spirochaetales bacterium]
MVQWTSTSHIVDIDIQEQNPPQAGLLSIASEPILKTIVDSIADGILILDAAGYVLYLNQQGANILDLSQTQVMGKHITTIVDFRPVILDVLENGQGYLEKEFIIHSPSRGKLHFMKSAIVLRDRHARMMGVIDTFRLVDSMHTMVARITGAKAKFSFNDIIGRDPAFIDAVSFSRIAAQSTANVLIEGESGTGKEMFAHAIHHASMRSSGPLIIVNCASLPRSLIESELFGYESGSFTGARKEGFPGKFEQANGGTIFLDEIAELPLDMQSKLLRVLQDHTFSRIGGTKNITVDTRVIAATNKNLLAEIRNTNFREDLYYRLNVLCIHTPSLRERLDDIPLLVNYFVQKNALNHSRTIPEIDPFVLDILKEYPWPGNIRELENVIERAIIISQSDQLTIDQLPQHIVNSFRHVPVPETANPSDTNIRNLEQMEKHEIRRTLKEVEGNISLCSKLLGISRNTLYRKMKQYAL